MATTKWHEKEALQDAAIADMQTVEVVLDIGCGIKPQNYIRPLTHICCEPYGEYISNLQQKIAALESRDRSYVLLNMGWSEAVRYFPPKSVDTVFLVDVIEHLEKEDGQKLLAATENIARRQIIVFTPLGFMPQHHDDGKDAWGLSGASWQEHKSGWLPEDFGENWQIRAAKEFHMTDSMGRTLENPYGAMWAIKTNPDVDNRGIFEGGDALGRIERERRREQAQLAQMQAELVQLQTKLAPMEAELAQKESVIRSLFFARIEYKIRRIIKRIFT